MEGLGVLQGNIRGMMQPNCLLMNAIGHPLGLLDQHYWTRKGGKDFVGKESLKWTNGLTIVNEHLGTNAKKVVLVQAREAAIFDFFNAAQGAALALVKIVGFAPTKKQPLPRVKILTQALERFYFMKRGLCEVRQNPYKISYWEGRKVAFVLHHQPQGS
jgi:hypothetical protein